MREPVFDFHWIWIRQTSGERQIRRPGTETGLGEYKPAQNQKKKEKKYGTNRQVSQHFYGRARAERRRRRGRHGARTPIASPGACGWWKRIGKMSIFKSVSKFESKDGESIEPGVKIPKFPSHFQAIAMPCAAIGQLRWVSLDYFFHFWFPYFQIGVGIRIGKRRTDRTWCQNTNTFFFNDWNPLFNQEKKWINGLGKCLLGCQRNYPNRKKGNRLSPVSKYGIFRSNHRWKWSETGQEQSMGQPAPTLAPEGDGINGNTPAAGSIISAVGFWETTPRANYPIPFRRHQLRGKNMSVNRITGTSRGWSSCPSMTHRYPIAVKNYTKQNKTKQNLAHYSIKFVNK